MLKDIDFNLIVFTLGGLVLVLLSSVVFSSFTEAVRAVTEKNKDKEKKKKEMSRNR